MKNIFLSASIPIKGRDKKYIETADIIAIRDSVIALSSVVLLNHRIIWGGHPSITPLVYLVMKRLEINIQDHLILYQSKFFEKFFPEDNNKFQNVILTDVIDGDIDKSLTHMRNRMFSEYKYSAAVFIGGMDGVIDEYKLYKEKYPNSIILPIASTGAAAKIIYEEQLEEREKNLELLNDYGYTSLFDRLLLDKI